LPNAHPFTGIYRRQNKNTGSSRTGTATNNTSKLTNHPPTHRRYALPTGYLGIYKGVSLCVVLCSLWVVGRQVFAIEKNGKKRGMSAWCMFFAGGQASRMASASGQTYVRQALPPRFTLCESWWP